MSGEDAEGEHWLTVWEAAAANEIESRSELDIEAEQAAVSQKLWISFQNTATAIAQVYMDKGNGGVEAFRNAARDATSLYKEGIESGRRLSELSCSLGYTRRSKEILTWAKKRRKFIRRDELIGMLAGMRKPSPSLASGSHTHNHALSHSHTHIHHHGHGHVLGGVEDEPDLATFRAAVGRHPSLQTLVTTEFQRVKRSSSPSDVHMDSPQPKKSRFL